MSAIDALELELRLIARRSQSSSALFAGQVHPKLDASAFPILAHISMNPGTRGSDLAAHFSVGRATISRQLARLEKLGLISREVDPEDTRGQLITLTSEGEDRFTHAREARVDAFAEALASWDEADIAQLAKLLHRYSDSFTAWRASQDPEFEG
ncbi:MAG: MarR family transcriptional regulator [Cellulomonadaceae bacterium]|nr:MarR family transcriptional regulator [Cellulomonadaceae bacterium]